MAEASTHRRPSAQSTSPPRPGRSASVNRGRLPSVRARRRCPRSPGFPLATNTCPCTDLEHDHRRSAACAGRQAPSWVQGPKTNVLPRHQPQFAHVCGERGSSPVQDAVPAPGARRASLSCGTSRLLGSMVACGCCVAGRRIERLMRWSPKRRSRGERRGRGAGPRVVRSQHRSVVS